MSWFQYLLQVNLYLILLYGFYALLLRNDTFFRLNRVYLLSSAIAAFLIPMLQFERIKALFITEQVRQTLTMVIHDTAPAIVIYSRPENNWTASEILSLVYAAGLLFFFGRFLFQLFSIYITLTPNSAKVKAYSFFDRINVSDNLEGRKTILEHEKVHVRQWHSADVLFFELIAIINWFNPVVYACKKALKHIHEFIADENAASSQITKENYSLLMVSNAFGVRPQQLSNSFFNQSLLKRRIIMLHKAKSKRIAMLKYGLSAPLLLAMLIFSSATIQEKTETLKNSADELVIARGNVDTEYERFTLASEPTSVSAPEEKAESSKSGLQIPDDFGKHMQNVNYVKSAKDKNIQGVLIATFKINNSGIVEDVKIIRGLDPEQDEELKRVLSSYKTTQSNAAGEYLFPMDFYLDGAPRKADVQTSIPIIAGFQPLQKIIVVGYAPLSQSQGKILEVQEPVIDQAAVQRVPEFPGGAAAWVDFMRGYNYPALARQNNIQGTIYVTFVIEKDGSLTDIKLLRDPGSGTGEEAIRLLKTSPKWNPGMQNGKTVRVAYTQPIRIMATAPAVSLSQDPIFTVYQIQIPPEFPGGPNGWGKFLQGYNYPGLARENNIQGVLYVTFVVEKDGSLTDIKMLRDLEFGTGGEALRLLKTSPKWNPGIVNGKPVRVAFTQTIKLSLQ